MYGYHHILSYVFCENILKIWFTNFKYKLLKESIFLLSFCGCLSIQNKFFCLKIVTSSKLLRNIVMKIYLNAK